MEIQTFRFRFVEFILNMVMDCAIFRERKLRVVCQPPPTLQRTICSYSYAVCTNYANENISHRFRRFQKMRAVP